MIISRIKVFTVVLLNPYFSSIWKVLYAERGIFITCIISIIIAANMSPVTISPNPKFRDNLSTILNPPARMNAMVRKVIKVSVESSNLVVSLRYLCDFSYFSES